MNVIASATFERARCARRCRASAIRSARRRRADVCRSPARRRTRERVDQPRQVLSRLDRADIQDDAIGQPVAAAHAIQFREVAHRPERRRRRLVHDVHAATDRGRRCRTMSRLALSDTVITAVGPARGDVHQRPIEEHAAQRMVARIHRQAHVVNRDDASALTRRSAPSRS